MATKMSKEVIVERIEKLMRNKNLVEATKITGKLSTYGRGLKGLDHLSDEERKAAVDNFREIMDLMIYAIYNGIQLDKSRDFYEWVDRRWNFFTKDIDFSKMHYLCYHLDTHYTKRNNAFQFMKMPHATLQDIEKKYSA